jgi:hypothetical protein
LTYELWADEISSKLGWQNRLTKMGGTAEGKKSSRTPMALHQFGDTEKDNWLSKDDPRQLAEQDERLSGRTMAAIESEREPFSLS